jgi:hypothetical protein
VATGLKRVFTRVGGRNASSLCAKHDEDVEGGEKRGDSVGEAAMPIAVVVQLARSGL